MTKIIHTPKGFIRGVFINGKLTTMYIPPRLSGAELKALISKIK